MVGSSEMLTMWVMQSFHSSSALGGFIGQWKKSCLTHDIHHRQSTAASRFNTRLVLQVQKRKTVANTANNQQEGCCAEKRSISFLGTDSECRNDIAGSLLFLKMQKKEIWRLTSWVHSCKMSMILCYEVVWDLEQGQQVKSDVFSTNTSFHLVQITRKHG